jgi:uncharacterized membrane protein
MKVDVSSEFQLFGRKMKYVAIFTIFGIIPYVGNIFSLINLILLFLCLDDIKNANRKLNSYILNNYRSKYLIALILTVFTSILGIIGSFPPFNSLKLIYHTGNLTITIDLLFIPALILFIIIGAVEMIVWQKLIDFSLQSSNLFPLSIKTNIIKGSKDLKYAAIMIILTFLMITILIAWILQIIGFFRLSTLEQYQYEEPQISTKIDSEPKSEVYIEDRSFSKFDKMIYQFLKQNEGKAFTFTAILNRIISKLDDENEIEYFKTNGEELLNQLSLKKYVNVVVKQGEVFYLIA